MFVPVRFMFVPGAIDTAPVAILLSPRKNE
jgi:hypothetical protein